MVAESRIGICEVWLDSDPVRWKALADEESASELGLNDIPVYVPQPRSGESVCDKHCAYYCARQPTATIASVDYAKEWRVPDARLTRAAVPEQLRIHAKQTVVVKRLHDGCFFRVCRIVGCGRDKRKGVVAMYNCWTVAPDQRAKLRIAVTVPHG